MKMALTNSAFVALGGALGALVRHLINLWTFAPAMPIGTVLENGSGALLLGIVVGYLARHDKSPDDAPAWLRAGLGTGFCGGYTTTSTFAADTFLVTVYQAPLWALAYVAASLIFGLLFALAGIAVGEALGKPEAEAL